MIIAAVFIVIQVFVMINLLPATLSKETYYYYPTPEELAEEKASEE